MRLSIIVPVYNNPQDLRECLAALTASAGPDSEIIVVDDASTDDTASVAVQMGVCVLQLAKNSGPAAARNYSAHHAQGDTLFFVDADVVVAPDAVRRVVELFAERSELVAVFASYEAHPQAPGLVSRYRNLAPSLRAPARSFRGIDVLGRVWCDPMLSLPGSWRLRRGPLSARNRGYRTRLPSAASRSSHSPGQSAAGHTFEAVDPPFSHSHGYPPSRHSVVAPHP